MCSVNGCGSKVLAKSLCSKHYWRLREHGTTDDTPRTKSVELRFLDKVEKTESCWEWTAGKNSGGYGQFNSDKGTLAHRFAYEWYVGDIPDGMCIMHKCDNPGCVNPKHLEVGTRADNNADRDLKGRWAHNGIYGESKPNAKLTEDLAKKIYQCDASYSVTADIFGVKVHDVADIKTHRRWVKATQNLERNTIEP